MGYCVIAKVIAIDRLHIVVLTTFTPPTDPTRQAVLWGAGQGSISFHIT